MNNMNISIKHYGIFYKDSRLLLRMAAVILIFQLVLMLTVPPLFAFLEQFPNFGMGIMPLGEWFPKLQIAMSIIFSLIAAGHWWAEERGAKTDLLLRRLPISSRQLWTEKTLAGMFCVLSFFIVQIIWFALLQNVGGIFGIKMENSLFEFVYILFNVTIYAYFIGLPFSYRLNHTIGVIVIGIAMFLPGLWIAAMIQTNNGKFVRRDTVEGILFGLSYIMSILPILLVIGVPFFMYLYFSWKYTRPNPRASKPFWVLVHKQYREMRGYFIAAILILILSIISIFSASLMILSVMWCVIIVAALLTGIASYTNDEKGGLQCVLYHHPIPLSHVYWSKILPSLGIATILSLSFVIIFFILLFNDTSGMALKLFGRPPRESVILNQLLVSNVLIPLCVMIFFAGLLPYTVGALISHIVPNTVYAFIESIPFGVGAVVCFLYLQFANDAVVSELIMYVNDSNVRPLPFIPWILIVLSALLLTAGWRSATDRRLLTATVLQRQFYILRLYLTVIAVTIIAFKVGLWDSLYLITGIDLGIG